MAALLGVLAAAAALGVGDLVAGLIAPPSSPFLLVGDQFIRLTPEWLKEFATATFGTSDKSVLLVSMAVVIAVLAVAAGLAGRSRALPGAVAIGVFGLLGVAAAAVAPAFTAVELVAPVAALLVGVGVFLLLHRSARSSAPDRTETTTPARDAGDDGEAAGTRTPAEGPATPSAVHGSLARRRLLRTGGVAAVAAVGTGIAGRWLAAASGAAATREAVGPIGSTRTPKPPVRADFAADGTPTWLTPARAFYRIDTALQAPQVAVTDYRLRIHGMVDRELNLTYQDLRRRKLVEAPITMTCVSNPVGGGLISNARFTGVPLRQLLAEAGVRPGAEQLASTSADGWTSGTPIDAATEPGRPAMLALGMNGAPLPLEHGFPVRMVVSGLYGFVSGCKWITDIEVTTFDAFTSYWQQRGWAQQAPIKTESRIDTPERGARVPAGRTVLAGIAWAQHTGIDRVEVRADGGPWVAAELAGEISRDTWRMWRASLDLRPGQHRLQVRATDRTGRTQTPKQVPAIPDGASGWHTISVTST